MAKIDKTALTDWNNGDIVKEDGLEKDFEVLRVALNATDDEIKANKTAQDGIATRVSTAESDINALELRATSAESRLTEVEKPATEDRIEDGAVTYPKLGIDLQASVGYEYEWTATEGQTLFELPSDMTYPVGIYATELVIGGLEQSSGAYIEASPSSIETTSAVPTGVKVKLKWRKGLMPTTSDGHQGTHQKGGLDPIRIDTLDQYQELVADKIGISSEMMTEDTQQTTMYFLQNTDKIRTRQILNVQGFYSISDEVYGKYRVLSVAGTETWTDIKDSNNITLFQISSIGELRAVGSTKKLKVMPRNGKYNVKSFGAKGDNVADDYAIIQNAMNGCVAGSTLFYPNGVYLISQTLVIPYKLYADRKHILLSLEGEKPVLTYRDGLTQNAFGAIIQTSDKSITAIKGPDKTVMTPYMSGWSREFSMSNITILGKQGVYSNWNDPAVSDKTSVGLSLDGIMQTNLSNIHIEGFGIGFKINDAIVDFTNRTIVRNCYKGLVLSRTDDGNEMTAVFSNLETGSNKINLELDNARAIFINAGSIISADAENELGTPGVIIKNSNELDLHIMNCVLESNRASDVDAVPLISIDSKGINVLTITDCNLTSLIKTNVIKTTGYFGAINFKNNVLHKNTILTTDKGLELVYPIIHIAFNSGENTKLKGMAINIEGNDPEYIQGFVKDDYHISGVAEVMPVGYKLLNSMPNCDRRVPNTYEATNAAISAFSMNNVLIGKARNYWINDDPSHTTNLADVHICDGDGRNPVRDLETIFVSIICNDNAGAKIPFVYLLFNGDGTSISFFTGGYFTQIASKVGEFTINGSIFSKYVIAVTIKKPKDTLFKSGIKALRIANIFGGNEYTGIEYIGVYGRTRHEKRTREFHSTAAPSGNQGYFGVGETIYSISSSAGSRIGWKCVTEATAGNSGTFESFGQVGYRTNAGSPSGILTPSFIGEWVLDTTNKVIYDAVGTANTDWKARS